MRKVFKNLLTISTLVFATSSFAFVKFGPSVGVGMSKYSVDDSSVDPKFDGDFRIGVQAKFDLPVFAVTGGVLYSTDGLGFEGSGVEGESSFQQIHVPVMGFYKIPLAIAALRFGAGVAFNYGFGDVKSSFKDLVLGATQDSEQSFKDSGLKKTSFDGLLAVGLDFALPGLPIDLSADLRGGLGLTDRDESSDSSKSRYFDLLLTAYF